MTPEIALIEHILKFLPLSDRLDSAIDAGTGLTLSAEETKNVGEFIGALMDTVESQILARVAGE